MNPVVSIIIPVYNMESTISSCLESVLAQTFQSYEAIVVNDGSIDKTESIVSAYTDDNHIILYSQCNQGVSSARNKGIELAKGKYILFVDADDWIESHYLEHIIKRTREYTADLYVFGLTRHYADGKTADIVPANVSLMNSIDFLTNLPTEHYKRNVGIYGYIPNKLMLRSIIIENKIRFSVELKLQEDYDFLLSYYRYCNFVYCFQYAGYHYMANTNVSRRGSVDYFSLIRIQQKCIRLLECHPESYTKDNENVLMTSIASLAQSAFLELHPVTLSAVNGIMEKVRSDKYVNLCLGNYNTSFKSLKKLVQSDCSFAVYIYLLVWRFYLYVRRI